MNPISRRTLIGGAAAFGTTLTAAADEPAKKEPARRARVVVAGGHPGDPEYGCGGTVARLTELGHDVALLYLNDGEWPPGSPPRGRTAEAAKACEILGARPLYAGQQNGRAVVDPERYDAFAKILDAERPDAVFTHWPIDNHADHRAISMLVYDAWLRSKKAFALFYYEVSNGEDTVQFAPTLYVDVTATEPKKKQACFAHASQSPEKFYTLQEHVTRMRGIEKGCRQAEGFVRHVQSPAFELPA